MKDKKVKTVVNEDLNKTYQTSVSVESIIDNSPFLNSEQPQPIKKAYIFSKHIMTYVSAVLFVLLLISCCYIIILNRNDVKLREKLNLISTTLTEEERICKIIEKTMVDNTPIYSVGIEDNIQIYIYEEHQNYKNESSYNHYHYLVLSETKNDNEIKISLNNSELITAKGPRNTGHLATLLKENSQILELKIEYLGVEYTYYLSKK